MSCLSGQYEKERESMFVCLFVLCLSYVCMSVCPMFVCQFVLSLYACVSYMFVCMLYEILGQLKIMKFQKVHLLFTSNKFLIKKIRSNIRYGILFK